MISVVIPMYNAESTIISCLDSVKNQTYLDFEIIIINDGSQDNGPNLVRQFISQNAQLDIKYLEKENGGVSLARNIGMKLAKGEYIAFLDSDDEWHKDKLKVQFEVLHSNPSIDLLGCNRNEEHFEKFYTKKFTRLTSISSRILLYKNFFSTPCVILKKEVLNNVGFFDEDQKYMEDCNYWMRICNQGNCMLLNESYVTAGGGKPYFGFSGLSSNLIGMEKGDLKNIKDAYKLGIVGNLEYCFLTFYSILKYIRRVIIVKLRS
jgi:glycosyltransferase involved in cell wall biosynthesis